MREGSNSLLKNTEDSFCLTLTNLRSATRNGLPAVFLSCGSTMRDAFFSPFHVGMGYVSYHSVIPSSQKVPVCCGLSPCKRGRYASVAFPTFWGTPSPAGKTRIFRENDTGRGFPQALLKSRPGRLPHKMGRLPLERVGERMDRPNERLRALSAYSARRRLVTDSRKNDDPPTGLHWSTSLTKAKGIPL